MPVSPTIRAALKAFYQATGGASWAGNDQWLEGPGSECDWERVRCNGAGDEATSCSAPRRANSRSAAHEAGRACRFHALPNQRGE